MLIAENLWCRVLKTDTQLDGRYDIETYTGTLTGAQVITCSIEPIDGRYKCAFFDDDFGDFAAWLPLPLTVGNHYRLRFARKRIDGKPAAHIREIHWE